MLTGARNNHTPVAAVSVLAEIETDTVLCSQVLEARRDVVLAAMSDCGHPQAHIGFTLTDIPLHLPTVDPSGRPLPLSFPELVNADPSPPEVLSAEHSSAALAAGTGYLDALLATFIHCELAPEEMRELREIVKTATDVASLVAVRSRFFSVLVCTHVSPAVSMHALYLDALLSPRPLSTLIHCEVASEEMRELRETVKTATGVASLVAVRSRPFLSDRSECVCRSLPGRSPLSLFPVYPLSIPCLP